MFLGFSWIGKYTNPINIRHGLKKNAGIFRSPLEARTSRNAWSTAECDATTSTRNLSGRNAIRWKKQQQITKGHPRKSIQEGCRTEGRKPPRSSVRAGSLTARASIQQREVWEDRDHGLPPSQWPKPVFPGLLVSKLGLSSVQFLLQWGL